MRLFTLYIFLLILPTFGTDWQPPEIVTGLDINGLNLDSTNLVMYGSKWRNSYWLGDIYYYTWSGSEWVAEDWIQGDVNSTDYDAEPFITYDGQHLYFERWNSGHYLYTADWNGSGFTNSHPLNSLINTGDSRYPSITQDGQKLYFSRGKIWESIWNGSDWDAPTILPPEVNEGGGLFRWEVTISPDGNEIYFTGAAPHTAWLAFSRKIGGVWQQWQFCDSNINPTTSVQISGPAFTYSAYASQYLYFKKNVGPPYTYRSLRSPVAVEPASLGQIKANYKR
jgi:hypothetical protein